ncbi:MAG: TonB family protein [Acidobacteria bacterium]|nr:TonB family protein [Acidobacteriota bacterium]
MRIYYLALLFSGLGWLQAQPASQLSADQVAAMEATLQEDPGDRVTRSRLLMHYATAQRSSPSQETILARRKHILWFVEIAPESPYAGMGSTWIDAAMAPKDPEGRKAVIQAWREVAAREHLPGDAYANSLRYLSTEDPALAVQTVRRALADPRLSKMGYWNAGKAIAAVILGATSLMLGESMSAAEPARSEAAPAQEARKILAESTAPGFLGAAVRALSNGQSMLRARKVESTVDADSLIEPVLARWAVRDRNDAMPFWVTMEVLQRRADAERIKERKLDLWTKAFEAGEMARKRGGEPDAGMARNQVQVAFEAGMHDKAVAYGTALLASPGTGSTQGQNVHDVNCWLGSIALQRGDKAAALRHLAEAAKSAGSPALGSFGPDFQLARDLASAGERDAVIAYLEGVRKFWKSGQGKLDDWMASLREGLVPSFNRFASPKTDRQKLVGKPAPVIPALATVGGERWDLAAHKGKIVLVDFWATWCVPCRQQMPALSAFYKAHKDEGFEMIGLSSGEDPEVVKSFLAKNPVSYPMAVAPDGVVNAYEAHTLPSAFWVNREGVVVAVDVGAGPDTEGELKRRWNQVKSGSLPQSRVVAVSGENSALQVIQRQQPGFTEEARKAGVNAALKVRMVVDVDGVPRDLKVERGAGFGLDERALATIADWRFKPAYRVGKPVATTTTVEVAFRTAGTMAMSRLLLDAPAGASRPVLERGRVPEPRSAGVFTVAFAVDETGGVEFVKASPEDTEWAAAAREALEKWHFQPARLGNAAVAVKATLEVTSSRR